MELDHIFICARPGAPEGDVLKKFGLVEGTPNAHPGQGTANRRFFFRNAYLELLFLDNAAEAQSELTRPMQLHERLTANDSPICPFGIAFRSSSTDEKNAPFPSWPYHPHYLPPQLQIDVGQGAPLSEPLWLFMEFASRPDAMPEEKLQPMAHRPPLREITSIKLTLPDSHRLSTPATCAAQLPGFDIVGGDGYLMEICFDGCGSADQHDFRPLLPLLFTWR